MSITYISNSRIPTEKAHGLQIFRMCEAFVKSGHTLELIVPRRLNPIKKDPFEFYDCDKIFRIRYIPVLDLVNFGKIGFVFTTLQFAVLSTIYSLFKKSDLVFTRDEILAAFNILIGKKVYWESHDAKYGFFAKFAIRRSEKIIVVSNGVEDLYKEKGFNNTKFVVACNAIRLEDFQFDFNKKDLRSKLDIPDDKPVVMYTGHLYDWKGADLLAQAGLSLSEYNFVFIGGTEKDIKNFKEKYAQENIFFHGFVENKHIPKYLKTADLLVIPNIAKNDISSKFTSPLKFFEYLASDVPILASDLPSLKVIGKDYVNYFKAGDLDDLSKKIIQILNFHDSVTESRSSKFAEISWDDRARRILDL